MRHYREYSTYLNHWLFKSVRAVVFARAKNSCELCGAVATEVHHTQYPAWGAFDTPNNIMAICHECHKKIHGRKH